MNKTFGFSRFLPQISALALGFILSLPGFARAQLLEPAAPSAAPNPLADPTMNAGKAFLFQLEARFAKDVADLGGAGFAAWFAADGVTLGNGAAPKVGKVAIASSATWSPKDYQ